MYIIGKIGLTDVGGRDKDALIETGEGWLERVGTSAQFA
jgi:hypothetical protein